jgi:SanA protein
LRVIKSKIAKTYKIASILILVMVLAIAAINLYILHCTKGCIYNEVADVPARDVGLVMGTDLLRFNGSTNLHFFLRSEGAVMLYQSGKAKRLLISGNSDNHGFNEVSGIEKEILARNVPSDALISDYHGNSTWNALKQASEMYHLHQIIIVTDDFHAPRAIYLSRHFGIDAVAFCHGREPFGFWTVRYHSREWLARVKAFIQVSLDTRSVSNG